MAGVKVEIAVHRDKAHLEDKLRKLIWFFDQVVSHFMQLLEENWTRYDHHMMFSDNTDCEESKVDGRYLFSSFQVRLVEGESGVWEDGTSSREYLKILRPFVDVLMVGKARLCVDGAMHIADVAHKLEMLEQKMAPEERGCGWDI